MFLNITQSFFSFKPAKCWKRILQKRQMLYPGKVLMFDQNSTKVSGN